MQRLYLFIHFLILCHPLYVPQFNFFHIAPNLASCLIPDQQLYKAQLCDFSILSFIATFRCSNKQFNLLGSYEEDVKVCSILYHIFCGSIVFPFLFLILVLLLLQCANYMLQYAEFNHSQRILLNGCSDHQGQYGTISFYFFIRQL